MAQSTGIPKGTRDFTPAEMVRRNYIFDTIRSVFQLYGFQPIETPAMENLSTLMGKYGEEGDKLLFKVLNSGDFLTKANEGDLAAKNSTKVTNQISEKGLRYDLTVPFARFVVQHRDEIVLPFKRYQIQPVWRADKPQAGRYREFYQCDVDVVGSNSILNEYELVLIVNDVFKRLGVRVCLKINNRKVLSGIAETIGEPDKIIPITIGIDKLDKIGIEAVKLELSKAGVSESAIEQLQPILELKGSTDEKISQMRKMLAGSEVGLKGIDELETLFKYIQQSPLGIETELDLSLARGLNYYTGAIFEVKALDVQIGSICGGGRYDDLTGIFGMKDVSGVGISFGADRIYDVLNKLDAYPADSVKTTKLLFINFGSAEEAHCIKIIQQVREAGFNAEIYPEAAKLKKQMNYADKKNIPWVAIIGSEEISSGLINLKNMKTGEQLKVSTEELITKLA